MKSLSVKLIISLLVLGFLAASIPAKAEMVCDDDALENTVVGGIFGGIFGTIATRGRPAGAAVGAAIGGAVGLGLSCDNYETYYRERTYVLDNDVYDRYWEWDGGRMRVTRTGYYNGLVCREYETYIADVSDYDYDDEFDGDYEVEERVITERACRYEGGWRVVNYPVTYFTWGGFYTRPVVYVPTARYRWGYRKHFGGHHHRIHRPHHGRWMPRHHRDGSWRHRHWNHRRDNDRWSRPSRPNFPSFPGFPGGRRDNDRRDHDRRDNDRRDHNNNGGWNNRPGNNDHGPGRGNNHGGMNRRDHDRNDNNRNDNNRGGGDRGGRGGDRDGHRGGRR